MGDCFIELTLVWVDLVQILNLTKEMSVPFPFIETGEGVGFEF